MKGSIDGSKISWCFQKRPYLLPLYDVVNGAQVVRIKELGLKSIKRWCGCIETTEFSFQIRVLAVLTDNSLCELFKSEKTHFLESLMFWRSRVLGGSKNVRSSSLDAVLAGYDQLDQVKEIILVGYDFKHFAQYQLYTYTLPNGKTVRNILDELNRDSKQTIEVHEPDLVDGRSQVSEHTVDEQKPAVVRQVRSVK